MNQEFEDFLNFLADNIENILGNLQGAGNGMASMNKSEEAELMQQMKSEFPALFEYAQQRKRTIEATGNRRFSVVATIRRMVLGIPSHPLPPDGIPPPIIKREMGDEEWWFEYHWDFNSIILLMMDRVGIDEVRTIMGL